jgi:hypothetical protein
MSGATLPAFWKNLLPVLFYPDDGGSRLLGKAGNVLPDYNIIISQTSQKTVIFTLARRFLFA